MAAFATLLLSVLLACITLSSQASDVPDYTNKDVGSPEVVEAADFAVKELQVMSDSGVYESLSLAAIISAGSQEGVFHDNIFLEVHLASPHFQSGAEFEKFEIIVMTSIDDGAKSFAIDEFPVMNEDAIEEYWIRKVEAHRAMREESFRQMEEEAMRSASSRVEVEVGAQGV